MTTAQQHPGAMTPADVDLQASAIAVLVEKIARLSQEEKDDMMCVVMEIKDCESESDLGEIQQTIREILFPEMTGGLLERDDIRPPSNNAMEALSKRREAISTKLKELRLAQNLTQAQLAEKSGLPQSHISRLEAGQHGPSLRTVERLAQALGVSTSILDPAQQ